MMPYSQVIPWRSKSVENAVGFIHIRKIIHGLNPNWDQMKGFAINVAGPMTTQMGL